MISGFDVETKPLDDFERITVLPRVIAGFHLLAKSGLSVTSTAIIRKLSKEGITITGPRLRKVINHIRTNDLVIGVVADGEGYRVVSTPEAMLEYLDSLDGRIESIRHMRDSLYRQYQKMHHQNLFSEPPASDPIPEPETKPPTQAQIALKLWMEENG